MAQSFLLNNFSISAPATSPVYTVIWTSSWRQSKDGGVNWSQLVEVLCDGGVQAKGANAGSPQTSTSTGAIPDLVAGNQLRARAATVSGTWVLTASVATS
jgi:hypothetical protein